MNIKIFGTIEAPNSEVVPKIKYYDDKPEKAEKAKKYLAAEREFFKWLEIDEAKFEWHGDILSYQHVFRIDDMVDKGELTEEEGEAKLLKDIPEMRALSEMLGQTMPAVSMIIRYKGTERYYPLQFLMCGHIKWPESEEIYLTSDELDALTKGLDSAVVVAKEDMGVVRGEE